MSLSSLLIAAAMPLALTPPAGADGPHSHMAPPPRAQVEAANRSALLEPQGERFRDAVQVFPWSEGALYRVYTAPGRITDIALEPGEQLTAVAAGDTVRWILGDTTSGSGPTRQVHVLLKPTVGGLSTNLVITTDRRIYRLEARSTTATAMAAVSWSYPAKALVALAGSVGGGEAAPTEPILAEPPFDFGYRLTGAKPSWRPLRVFDDGRQVYIEFPAGLDRDQAPPLFAIGSDGAAELLNYRVRGRFYVVDRLFARAELRLGGRKRQVVRIMRTEGTAR